MDPYIIAFAVYLFLFLWSLHLKNFPPCELFKIFSQQVIKINYD